MAGDSLAWKTRIQLLSPFSQLLSCASPSIHTNLPLCFFFVSATDRQSSSTCTAPPRRVSNCAYVPVRGWLAVFSWHGPWHRASHTPLRQHFLRRGNQQSPPCQVKHRIHRKRTIIKQVRKATRIRRKPQVETAPIRGMPGGLSGRLLPRLSRHMAVLGMKIKAETFGSANYPGLLSSVSSSGPLPLECQAAASPTPRQMCSGRHRTLQRCHSCQTHECASRAWTTQITIKNDWTTKSQRGESGERQPRGEMLQPRVTA